MPELYEYNGSFSLSGIDEAQHQKLVELFKESGITADVESTYLCFEYSGRDTNRKVVRLFSRVAELVGELDGKIIATCMAGYEGHRGWINSLAVLPPYQRRDFATQMMQDAEKLLRDAGCPKINLQIRTSNADVIAFYQAIGFRKDDIVSMGKRLEQNES